MTAPNDDATFDDCYRPEDDGLVRRLRSLDWPSVGPELRERCWADFMRRLSEPEGTAHEAPATAPEPARRNVARRQGFSRRVPVARDRTQALGAYASARWAWQRPSVSVTASLTG